MFSVQSLASRSARVPLSMIRTIYMQRVQSVFDYAADARDFRQCDLDLLEKVQTIFVRKIFRANNHVDLRGIKFDFGLHRLKHRHQQLMLNAWFAECSYRPGSVHDVVARLATANGVHKIHKLVHSRMRQYDDCDGLRNNILHKRMSHAMWLTLVEKDVARARHSDLLKDLGSHDSLHQIATQLRSIDCTTTAERKVNAQPYRT